MSTSLSSLADSLSEINNKKCMERKSNIRLKLQV